MKKYKLILAYSIILFINLLFGVKYLSRFSEYGFLYAFVVLGIQIISIFFFNRRIPSKGMIKYFSFLFLVFLLGVAIISHYYIPIQSLNVDRVSVINSFLTKLFNGNYPYFAKSNMGNYPGPMPVYFLIALPFQLIGELNILSTLGYFIFFLMLIKQPVKPKFSLLILFVTSIFVYWEIATRSNIFTNSLIILLVINLYLRINKNNLNKRFFSSALLSGFFLSTRSIFILVYIVTFFSSYLRKEVKFTPLVKYSLIALSVFIFTFLPFILFFKNEFFIMNPFIIQSAFLIPKGYIFIFVLISIVFSFYVKNDIDTYFYSGVSLFVSIAIYFLYHLSNTGFYKTLFASNADISYFIFCVPFLFYFITLNPQGSS